MEHSRFRSIVCGALFFACALPSAFAADRPSPLLPVDRSDGEDDAIGRRIEWFVQARDLDATPGARMRRGREVKRLQQQVANGVPALLASEAWQPLGPEGMTMLDWD